MYNLKFKIYLTKNHISMFYVNWMKNKEQDLMASCIVKDYILMNLYVYF